MAPHYRVGGGGGGEEGGGGRGGREGGGREGGGGKGVEVAPQRAVVDVSVEASSQSESTLLRLSPHVQGELY